MPDFDNTKEKPGSVTGEAVADLPRAAAASGAEAAVGAAAQDAATVSAGVAPEEFTRLKAEKDDLVRTLQRLQADFDNYRKRVERDRGEERARVLAGAVESLLPVLDGLGRALVAHTDPAYEDYRKGFDLIYRQLWDVLARLGLERIDAAGKPFDPRLHQAVERVESKHHADGIVLEEMQAGYRFRDRVLRPAMVRVAVHPAPPPDWDA